MKIGIVSDTHLYTAKKLPKILLDGLKKVDMILHAGDWVSLEIANRLEQIAPIDGVAGNNDGFDIIDRFGESKIIELNQYRIGMIHGDGFQKTTESRAWEAFAGKNVDMIIFGHSHIPLELNHKGVLLFNPGSPTDKRRQAQYSYGIMELGETIKTELFYFDNLSTT